MAYGKAPAIRVCTRPDHPARRHGHYGYGGRYWCSDFRSPLLGEANMGHVERGWIVIFEKPAPPAMSPTARLATVDGKHPAACFEDGCVCVLMGPAGIPITSPTGCES